MKAAGNIFRRKQGCGSAFIFADPEPSVFLNADPDPGGKMNADPCESGSTALDGYTKQNGRMHTLLSSNMTQQWSDRDSIYSTKSYL